ncbi:hypothetical protein GCM10007425_31240 [Lysinibacillus alkalisoli]|uniref:Uncharacterized protein n=1 Tax=Lysinibacillus alkalisoli TaxID=1911548 RepID=A0A917LK65_9BACI|nr:hypothetical protein [Lysinibacillus alkalisoli]GGG34265.1 hypothetical protein GCM10007425_31240 [Lysinibacillus alkalisoli]
MKFNNEDQKVSKVVWVVAGTIVGSSIGAIIGIIAYNNHWWG